LTRRKKLRFMMPSHELRFMQLSITSFTCETDAVPNSAATGRRVGPHLDGRQLMRSLVAGALICIALTRATTSHAQEAVLAVPVPPPVLSDEQLLRKYVWTTLGPAGAIGATFVSSFDQWRGFPSEWGGGVSGYSKRWASAYAAGGIGN